MNANTAKSTTTTINSIRENPRDLEYISTPP